jgi:hypothetical protein
MRRYHHSPSIPFFIANVEAVESFRNGLNASDASLLPRLFDQFRKAIMARYSSNRRADLKQVGHLYKFEAPFGETICAYCGEFATTLDHVLPVSAAVKLLDMICADRSRYRHCLMVVPCCSDCNTRLTNRFFTNITDKRQCLARLLWKKHYRLLGAYDWDQEELDEMGRMLHDYIESRDSKRKVIEDRIRFARSNGNVR